LRRSVVPSSGAKSPPHVVVIGNQKGGSGKYTFAMHIIVALLKAGNAEAKDVVGVDYSPNIFAYSALSENGRAIRSQEMQKLLLGYRDNMRVEVETGVAVTAKTVADLRALPAWPDGLALNIHVDLDPRFSVVRVERAASVVQAS
jgi:cellulose biosynthesis protein BcsQ